MYYKIIRGYGAEDYISINSDELEKAYYCFLEKKDSIFTGGAVKGTQIMAIQPDYHKTMGWNRGYKLEALDFEELEQKGVDRKMQKQLSTTKEKVQYLIQSNQTDLIGKNFELPKLETVKDLEVSDEVKKLADKFRIDK